MVIIYVSVYCCDALIVERSQIRSIRLSTLLYKDIESRAESLGDEREDLLEWLWDYVARPILDGLKISQASDGSWPRIWWIPTGPLSRFPIHAAGYYLRKSSETVIDRAVSSYSTSIKSIVHNYETRSRWLEEGRPNKLVLVAMTDTPGYHHLHFVTQETTTVRHLCDSMALHPHAPRTNKEAVLAALQDCHILHFAGHRRSEAFDPLKSQLLLEDWKDTPLTVADLLDINLRSGLPFLACLSACGTSEATRSDLIDENIHLASACQLAGFRHVIGTLWEVDDESCVTMAETTYGVIADNHLSDGSVSLGLHEASRRLRDKWVEKNTSAQSGDRSSRTSASRSSASRDRISSGELRDPRKAEFCDEESQPPIHWAPYVHLGI